VFRLTGVPRSLSQVWVIQSVNNLGVIFDKRINMYEHVTPVYRTAYYQPKNIHCLKAFLTQEALVTVVDVYVIFLIDYCNSLLYVLFCARGLCPEGIMCEIRRSLRTSFVCFQACACIHRTFAITLDLVYLYQ